MEILERFYAEARRRNQSVVLPEGQDTRVIQAARKLVDDGLARPILLGSLEAVQSVAEQEGVDLAGISVVDPSDNPWYERYVELYADRRQVKHGVARRMVKKPIFFGGMMVAQGDAGTMVAGAAHATATVIQAGALTIGLSPGLSTVSSFFLMVLPEFQGEEDRPFIFADYAVTIEPDASQLADIALASHASAAKLLTETPRIAMLSFSTLGSAAHERIDIVTQALAMVQRRAPELLVDGEFQLDSAIVPGVAVKKVKRASEVAGRANVLVFPDLNTGNVAYKLAQYMAGAQAIGPFLQGFAKPISDLSRGASASDIVATTAIVLAMA